MRGLTRARRLAERLGLDADELGLLWFVVALTSDPLLGPHALALSGADARRGASLAFYATVADLPPARVRSLSIQLGPMHPLFRYALLESGDPTSVPALAPLSAPRRVCRHLAGDDSVDDLVAAAGGLVAVLTTNLDASIDPALRRRLAAHIVFPKPDRLERAALWERLLGERAPLRGPLDFHRLAQQFPDLTGGTIRNAVVNAAFLGAAEGGAITQDHLERAAWNEYRAIGRLCVATKGNDP